MLQLAFGIVLPHGLIDPVPELDRVLGLYPETVRRSFHKCLNLLSVLLNKKQAGAGARVRRRGRNRPMGANSRELQPPVTPRF
jgi:hypothetical protein